MKINNKYLPIGTVVLLKNGKKELMIVSYQITPNGEVYDKNGKVDLAGTTFDYGACLYPEGIIASNQVFAFNHDQIDKVCFTGYQTDAQKEISNLLNERQKKAENK